MKTRGGMHQTTVRFGEDLWRELEREAERTGVSAAQFIRDATLARLAYGAGQRAGPVFGEEPARLGDVDASAFDARSVSSAVWAQARLARQRAQSVRSEAKAAQAQSKQGREVRGEDARLKG